MLTQRTIRGFLLGLVAPAWFSLCTHARAETPPAPSPAPLPETAGERERVWADNLSSRVVTIAVNGESYNGYLIPPPTSSTFRFKLAETGDVIEFRWSSLAASERVRVQQIFGIQVEDGRLTWGEKVQGTRLKLKSGKCVTGLECPERALPGRRCLRTSASVYYVGEEDVEAEEPAELRESDVYTPKEYYERKRLERPPGNDASEHERLARLCVQIGCHEKALDHFEMAGLIDPRCEERLRPLRQEAAKRLSEQYAEQLYMGLLADMRGGDYASAVRKIDAMGGNFSESEFRTRAEALRGEAEAGFQASYKRQVIQMYYTQMLALIRKRLALRMRVDKDGHPVPVEPGKQVTTQQGHVFRGTLLEDAEDHVTILTGDTKLTIRRKDVLSITDCDLSEAAGLIAPTFAELKAYVTSKDGLGRDLAERISDLLKVEIAKVQDTWESRFDALAFYDDGEVKKSKTYTVRQTANFGVGSWLCDGAQQIVDEKFGQRPRLKKPANDINPDPEASDDPEKWWKTLSNDQKTEILRAFAGMRLFRLKDMIVNPCPECGGQGFHEVLTPAGKKDVLCLTCRGLQAHFKVDFE